MGPSLLRREDPGEEEHTDWRFYYVGIFVDRDMLMRYLGGGIGHKLLRGIISIADTFRTLLKRSPNIGGDADKTPKATTHPEFEFDDDEEVEEVDMEGVELVMDDDEDEEEQQELDEGDREVKRYWDENDEHGYDDEDDE
ncbi:hypothetical protein EIP86_005808 [Pleurotus ostreatoroseus]|nr:hypothetical protein EIP86_005808 [Pleurotus ostreatoroseus]